MSEPVVVGRTSQTLAGYVDPDKLLVYVEDPTADVHSGDVLAFRGAARRVTEEPHVWGDAGLTLAFEAAPALLPDLGELLRNSTVTPILNEDTGVLTPVADYPIWTGPCNAEAENAQGNDPELGNQRVGIVPYLITVPLSLVDVRAGDQFRVTQSRDSRLTTRMLTITAIRGSSTNLTRELVAFDNQGGA